MYILVDIEWVQNNKGIRWPTQIAAMRVDECWHFQNMFYSQIQPPEESFCLWDHMAYTGGSSNEFLSAPKLPEVTQRIAKWLRDDDVLCWWTSDSLEIFREVVDTFPQKQLVLFPYLRSFLAKRPYLLGSPYHIAAQLNIERYGSRHDSRSDAEMMRRALGGICFPHELLQAPVPETTPDSNAYFRYVLDVTANRVHERDCKKLSAVSVLKEYPGLKTIVTNGYKPCACCSRDFAAARRERNRWIIDNSEYNYIFSPNSKIFHTRDCKMVLSSAVDVRGTVKYKTCIQRKRKPCKLCKPVPPETEKLTQKKKSTDTMPVSAPRKQEPNPGKDGRFSKRVLTVQEQRALHRLKQAQAERENMKNMSCIGAQEKEDLRTLSQPAFAFWAAAGFGSFHLRHCSKLNALSNLRGFALYEDAVRMGYRPCKQCKPSVKHNLEISLPIYSRERNDETIDTLTELCEEHGFAYTKNQQVVQIETAKGIWRIDTDSLPCRIEHINKIYTPGNTTEFHVQPRLFLSLTDIFLYIKRHDSCSTNVYNDHIG